MRGRGRSRELDVVAMMRDAGHVAYRLAQGPADVVVLGGGLDRPMLVQVKSTSGGPWERFTPTARAQLLVEAELAGADPVLCWWPLRREPTFIDSTDWPRPRLAVAA